MPAPIYYSAVVVDNLDPDQLGRLRLTIPGFTGPDNVYPTWVAPRVTPGAGPAGGWVWVPPVDALVCVELDAGGQLRWTGGDRGAVNGYPSDLASNYPRRSGWASVEGRHTVALDEDAGLLVFVEDDDAGPDGAADYLALGSDGRFQVGLASGATLLLTARQVVVLTEDGDTLCVDADNGITLAHHDGAELLNLRSGVAALNGTAVQISGGTIDLGGGTIPPVHPYLLSTAFFTQLSAALLEVIAAEILAGGSAVQTTALQVAITTSLAAGAPYLSTRIKGD